MSPSPQRLLAKSLSPGEGGTELPDQALLPGHLRETLRAAETLWSLTGREQLCAVGLDVERWGRRFHDLLCLASVLHDIGKANDHFQGLVQPIPGRQENGRPRPQGLRHEWVGALSLLSEEVLPWLVPVLRDDFGELCLYCAVTGHHPGHGRPYPPRGLRSEGSGSTLFLYRSHPDFTSSLALVPERLGLEPSPSLSDEQWSLAGRRSVFRDLEDLAERMETRWSEASKEQRRFVAALKAAVLASDVAGSALPRNVTGQDQRTDWLHRAFEVRPTQKQIRDIVECRLKTADGQIRSLRPFQRRVAEQAGDVTFVKAGCGSGKTLAAWHWAAERCPGKRLYFCYPTTGTATEGYRDYLYDEEEKAGRFGADLFHGRAEVDLERILGVQDGTERDREDQEDPFLRIQSLDAWYTPIVSCTVDTVLGIVQNHRKGLYTWPALAGSAFVFDEIHAYDDRLFGALLAFLEHLPGIPALLMTASLPRHRLELLRKVVQKRGCSLAEPESTEDLQSVEARPRYRRVGIGEGDPFERVRREWESGGKILWVCNTVRRAMEAWCRAAGGGLNPRVYHSRFRYEDRVRRHAEVMEAFRRDGSALVIATQVAEMSLDLSATLLVTDLSPVPALIQRLGRLNRYAREGDAPCPFWVVEPRDERGEPSLLPYQEVGWWESSQEWLGRLPVEAISQSDLASAWEVLMEEAPSSPCVSSFWVEGGPQTEVRPLRDPAPGVTVILERDLAELRRGNKRLAEVLLPMNAPPKGWEAWKRYRGIPVAPEGAVDYEEEGGASWRR